MADSFKLELIGAEQIERLLADLPQAINDRILADVNRAGAKIVKKALEEAAPEGDNDKASKNKIKNNVTIIKNPDNKTGSLVGFKKEAFPVLFNEKGTKVRKTKGGKGKKYKAGANRGKMERRPFVSQTHEQAVPQVINFINQNYAKIIDKAIRKQLKRIKK